MAIRIGAFALMRWPTAILIALGAGGMSALVRWAYLAAPADPPPAG